MKTEIYLVTGFFDSGKTTFINTVLKNSRLKGNKPVVVLQCEQGIEKYETEALENVFVEAIETKSELNEDLIWDLIEKYSPGRIFIEYNGPWEAGDFLKIPLPPGCAVRRIIHVADASAFMKYMTNMAPVLAEPISNSDYVLLNRTHNLAAGEYLDIKKTVHTLRGDTEIITMQNENAEELGEIFEKRRFTFKQFLGVLAGVFLFCFIYVFLSFSNYDVFSDLVLKLRQINTIFAGILMQAIPFLLIGVFVSSILQVMVPQEKLAGLFLKNRWLAMPLAACMGIALPLCDCAMAPIVSGMTRKGVPLPYAVTFLLAAPVVNPVVISSTLYAFPDQPQIAFYRILLGLAVSLAVGGLFFLIPYKKLIRLGSPLAGHACEDSFAGNTAYEGAQDKIKAVFRHAGTDFLNTGRFVILGAFIAAILQLAIPKAAFADAGGTGILAFLIVAGISLFMSICATSNAFIARSFSGAFSIGGILGFMVMGPMLDLKNQIMLAGFFGKKFVFVLALLVLAVSFAAFCLISAIA